MWKSSKSPHKPSLRRPRTASHDSAKKTAVTPKSVQSRRSALLLEASEEVISCKMTDRVLTPLRTPLRTPATGCRKQHTKNAIYASRRSSLIPTGIGITKSPQRVRKLQPVKRQQQSASPAKRSSRSRFPLTSPHTPTRAKAPIERYESESSLSFASHMPRISQQDRCMWSEASWSPSVYPAFSDIPTRATTRTTTSESQHVVMANSPTSSVFPQPLCRPYHFLGDDMTKQIQSFDQTPTADGSGFVTAFNDIAKLSSKDVNRPHSNKQSFPLVPNPFSETEVSIGRGGKNNNPNTSAELPLPTSEKTPLEVTKIKISERNCENVLSESKTPPSRENAHSSCSSPFFSACEESDDIKSEQRDSCNDFGTLSVNFWDTPVRNDSARRSTPTGMRRTSCFARQYMHTEPCASTATNESPQRDGEKRRISPSHAGVVRSRVARRFGSIWIVEARRGCDGSERWLSGDAFRRRRCSMKRQKIAPPPVWDLLQRPSTAPGSRLPSPQRLDSESLPSRTPMSQNRRLFLLGRNSTAQ